MPKVTFSRKDVESLCDRLDAKAWSSMFIDMPSTQRDLRSASALLRWMTGMGVPVLPVELDIINGMSL
jgi:hypothetical protein